MTEDELAALEVLTEAATPGPWEWLDYDLHAVSVANDDPWDPAPGQKIIVTDGGAYPPENADATFIAATRTAVPALIAELRRLREVIAALVADDPRCYFGRDGEWACACCDKVGYHAPDCPWAHARAALGIETPV